MSALVCALSASALVVLAPVALSAPPEAPSTRLSGPPADRVLRERSDRLLHDPAASLREATRAAERGDRSHAIWLYEQTESRHPIIGDHAALRRARLLLEAGQPTPARAALTEALARYPESPLKPDLYELLGEIRAFERNEEAARAAWTAALAETRDEERRARLLIAIAASQERSGAEEEAGITYRLIWYTHPTSEVAEQATHRLDVVEAYLERSLRRATDWRRRADRLYRQRDNDRALEAYDRALELGLSRHESGRVKLQRARTLFRMRRYPEAVEAFKALPQTGDTPIWYARSLARADRVPESIEAFERMAEKGGPNAERAAFLAALLLDGRQKYDRSLPLFRTLARGRGGMADAALWRLGWGAHQAGHLDEAESAYARLEAKTARQGVDGLRARYWHARVLLDQGREDEARASLTEIARGYPLSYYGWRARSHATAPLPSPSPRTIDAGRQRLKPAELARLRILMAAGLTEAGRDEAGELSRRARGLSDRLGLAQLLTDAGDFNRAQRLVVDAYSEDLARGPIPGMEELWWYAWPSAFDEDVRVATETPDSVDPELVYAIMREESGYRPEVVSVVGARGLLQIMTETGERLARAAGRPSFDPDDLFDPQINIDLGSFYLAELGRRFQGRLSASIASYNAGPNAVEEWAKAHVGPDDAWVEAIPYDQTRSYVKRVMRSVHAYRVLY